MIEEIFMVEQECYFMLKWISFVAIACAGMIGGCHYVNQTFGLKDDHPAEQFLEAIIKAETSLEIDLSPE